MFVACKVTSASYVSSPITNRASSGENKQPESSTSPRQRRDVVDKVDVGLLDYSNDIGSALASRLLRATSESNDAGRTSSCSTLSTSFSFSFREAEEADSASGAPCPGIYRRSKSLRATVPAAERPLGPRSRGRSGFPVAHIDSR